MLAVLQVQHLTRVELGFPSDSKTDSTALSMVLARLSNLQQLHLGDMYDASLRAALTALVQLPQLTLLKCNVDWAVDVHRQVASRRSSTVALQQLLAQPLPLKSLQRSRCGSYQLPVLNMALLTNLTELSTGCCVLAEATVLPAQLQRLQFWAEAHSMEPLTRLELKQLQHLSLRVDFEQPQLLLQLAQLPALTHLALQYDKHSDGLPAAATASAWPLLPQLRELEIEGDAPHRQPEWEAILAGAAAAAGLTKLALDARMWTDELEEEFRLKSDDDDDEMWASEVAACASLAKLTCLQDLKIYGAESDRLPLYPNLNLLRGDALALTALTRLTRLDLCGARHGVGPVVATALARSLQQLQDLNLGFCSLQLSSAKGLACLEAIGRLTQLTWLSLYGNGGELTQQGLMQLTGLSRLDPAARRWLGAGVG
jgi:hypothetical protein